MISTTARPLDTPGEIDAAKLNSPAAVTGLLVQPISHPVSWHLRDASRMRAEWSAANRSQFQLSQEFCPFVSSSGKFVCRFNERAAVAGPKLNKTTIEQHLK